MTRLLTSVSRADALSVSRTRGRGLGLGVDHSVEIPDFVLVFLVLLLLPTPCASHGGGHDGAFLQALPDLVLEVAGHRSGPSAAFS